MKQQTTEVSDDVQVESVDDLSLIWSFNPLSERFNYELRQLSESQNIAVLVRVDTELRSMDDRSHPKKILKVGEYQFDSCEYPDPESGELVTENNELEAYAYYGDWGTVSETDSPSGVDGAGITDLSRDDDMLVLECMTEYEIEFTMRFRYEETLESMAVEEAIAL